MAGKNVIELTDDQFAATIQDGDTPVLVDFWAEWCAPCRHIAPIVEELAQEYAGKLRVAKVNIDLYQQAANQFGIQSIPTLLLFKKGELAKRITGAVPKDQLVKAIGSVL
jgi:thioredoxin 1